MACILQAKPLTAEAFRPFGDVIEASSVATPAASGSTLRFDDQATVDVGADGEVAVNLLQTTDAISLPCHCRMLECHPLGSQAFIPRDFARLLIVVTAPGETPDLDGLEVFITDGTQGMNFKPGVWHMPLSSLDRAGFVMIERKGPGNNLKIFDLSEKDIGITA